MSIKLKINNKLTEAAPAKGPGSLKEIETTLFPDDPDKLTKGLGPNWNDAFKASKERKNPDYYIIKIRGGKNTKNLEGGVGYLKTTGETHDGRFRSTIDPDKIQVVPEADKNEASLFTSGDADRFISAAKRALGRLGVDYFKERRSTGTSANLDIGVQLTKYYWSAYFNNTLPGDQSDKAMSYINNCMSTLMEIVRGNSGHPLDGNYIFPVIKNFAKKLPEYHFSNTSLYRLNNGFGDYTLNYNIYVDDALSAEDAQKLVDDLESDGYNADKEAHWWFIQGDDDPEKFEEGKVRVDLKKGDLLEIYHCTFGELDETQKDFLAAYVAKNLTEELKEFVQYNSNKVYAVKNARVQIAANVVVNGSDFAIKTLTIEQLGATEEKPEEKPAETKSEEKPAAETTPVKPEEMASLAPDDGTTASVDQSVVGTDQLASLDDQALRDTFIASARELKRRKAERAAQVTTDQGTTENSGEYNLTY